MKYLKHINPTGAVADFKAVWQENPYRWRVLAVAIAMSGLMFYGFLPENQRADPRPPTITWITTFEPGRTDAEILQSNMQNQQIQDKWRAVEQERIELRKELYRELGRATGLDVDAMEAEIKRQEAAEAAAKARPQAAAGAQQQAPVAR